MAFKQITSSFSAAPQLTQDDLAAAAKAGYRSIISSRPDGEEAGQPSAEEMARMAGDHGLAFAHVPIVPGKATDADADRMKEKNKFQRHKCADFFIKGLSIVTEVKSALSDHNIILSHAHTSFKNNIC